MYSSTAAAAVLAPFPKLELLSQTKYKLLALTLLLLLLLLLLLYYIGIYSCVYSIANLLAVLLYMLLLARQAIFCTTILLHQKPSKSIAAATSAAIALAAVCIAS